MRLLGWSVIWIATAILITGLISYISADLNVLVWQAHLRVAGGIFFMIALIVGGVLTTDSAYRNRKRDFYREDWSFICILVTVTLFGISFILS
ncbi:hypothetical protein ACFO25_19425 [Paenactinomyces guangxiensis]|uniref:Uncharacterized protein n=1 Tax=Paenactinomyces guangxiensis TaxID=1490290 RepID=A0A7W2A9R4_9BACL|nr:hypothetical protein [Paenactinomyces guangxiensis]MBA4495482.1 hypothetical protein [Paenactinomyces guangxiensis]MBH8592395.1 hypothetical protein [Paenactinomyces guangxiensis]